VSYAEGTRGQIILSSTDPKAMRRYVRAGFDLVPSVTAAGIVDRGALPAPHPDVRAATGDDLDLTEAASRFVRGATHAPEHPQRDRPRRRAARAGRARLRAAPRRHRAAARRDRRGGRDGTALGRVRGRAARRHGERRHS